MHGTYYSKEHTWLKVDGEIGTIGITSFAQSELGEIVFVERPSVGKQFKQNEVFGTVEAVKTVSDLFMPVACEVIEQNAALTATPTLINSSAENEGWIIKIRLLNPREVETLLDASGYQGTIQ